jgi:hypothetical protein
MTKHTIPSLWVVLFFLFNFPNSDKESLPMYTRLASNSLNIMLFVCIWTQSEYLFLDESPGGRETAREGGREGEGEGLTYRWVR